MENGRFWRLEVLVPCLILITFLCDAAGRFVRIEPLAFRADEALLQFRSGWLPGPFEPNRHYRNERSYGDMAVISNQPKYRVYREQSFTTDEIGFRNATDRGTAPPEVLMVGSSFTLGNCEH